MFNELDDVSAEDDFELDKNDRARGHNLKNEI